jgi:hypothetical protein
MLASRQKRRMAALLPRDGGGQMLDARHRAQQVIRKVLRSIAAVPAAVHITLRTSAIVTVGPGRNPNNVPAPGWAG